MMTLVHFDEAMILMQFSLVLLFFSDCRIYLFRS